MTPTALTAAEFDVLKAWLDEKKTELPEAIHILLGRLIALYAILARGKKNTADIVKTLRMAMGMIPTSERGKQLLEKR